MMTAAFSETIETMPANWIGPEGSSSQTIDKIAKALVAASADMPSPRKDAVNPHFGSGYATLDAVLSATRPVLAKHGLAMFFCGGGAVTERAMLSGCSAVVLHTSGEWVRSTISMPIAPDATPQQFGSLLTYARRYAALSVLGIAPDEDDDANSASAGAGSAPPAQRRAPAASRGSRTPGNDAKAGAATGNYKTITEPMAGRLVAIARTAGDACGVHGFEIIRNTLYGMGIETPPDGCNRDGMVHHILSVVTPDLYEAVCAAVEAAGTDGAPPADEPPPIDDDSAGESF
ncbi:MAG TPA: ERF family protein [Polyangia bacterium]|nr:ERF family protein [Polyangia bacterium]